MHYFSHKDMSILVLISFYLNLYICSLADDSFSHAAGLGEVQEYLYLYPYTYTSAHTFDAAGLGKVS